MHIQKHKHLQKIRRYIFLKDVLILTLSAFGGPQAHIGMLFERMVNKRKYVTNEELLELNALCQILPGPTSTQTIVALAYKIGGASWAYLTLLVWALPAVLLMILAAVFVTNVSTASFANIFKFIEPIAIGCMAFAAYTITTKVVTSKVAISLMVFAGVIAFFIHSPWLFPLLIIIGGITTSFKYKKHKEVENPQALDIEWKNFILWITVFLGVTILASVTDFLPLKLFQKFYRNGSLVLGGGQVLIPMLYTEFVEYKQYMSAQQFNIGYALVHLVPGPVFSLSAYLGVITARSGSLFIQLLSGFTSASAIFLPGTFLIFFIIKFWEQLKQYRAVKASLEGINAINSGLIIAACISMFYATPLSLQNTFIMFFTFAILTTQKVSTPIVIIIGILAGIISGYI